MKIIYVMGLGRSGSTILDVVLGNHPALRSVGQFSNFVRVAWMNSRPCSCGHASHDCPFWSHVRQRWHQHLGSHSEREYEAARQSYERISRGPFNVPVSRLGAERFRFYLDSTVALYQSVYEACEGKTLVDSSKIPLRALHLSRVDTIDLRIIHNIRDARAAAFSWNKPSKRRPRGVTHTAVDWMASNLLSEWVLQRARETKSLRLRNEDFVNDPVGALHSIGDLIDEDMDPVITQLLENRPMRAIHLATGNRVIWEKQIRLRPDMEWRSAMSDRDKRKVWAITWPLMVRYGYPRTARSGDGP
ncbi:MAG TPA: sulfotransferase [Gemmatimonadota bacterium]|nr:sulfotransferase [Gemmatimonadota bacterium]